MDDFNKINGYYLGYNIIPTNSGVYAEVWRKLEGADFQSQLINKKFGSIWRPICGIDYERARRWCKNHIKWIEKAHDDIDRFF